MTIRTPRYTIASTGPFRGGGAGHAASRQANAAADAGDTRVEDVMFLHIQRSGISQVATVKVAELMMLFHDGMLMPITRMGPGRGGPGKH
jgi:hypothetical protein